jgi:hypothetical protein
MARAVRCLHGRPSDWPRTADRTASSRLRTSVRMDSRRPRTPVRVDTRTPPSGPCGPPADPRSDAAARCCEAWRTAGTARAAGGGLRRRAHHRHRPASQSGGDAAAVQASTTRPCDGGVHGSHRDCLPGHGRPGRLDTVDMDGWTLRPVAGGGRGRRAGPAPALGDGDHDQGDEEPNPVTATSPASVCLVERGVGRADRSCSWRSAPVMSMSSSCCEDLLYDLSRPACGRPPAAAVLGRQRPPRGGCSSERPTVVRHRADCLSSRATNLDGSSVVGSAASSRMGCLSHVTGGTWLPRRAVR